MSSNTETGHNAFDTGSGRGRAARSPLAIPARGWFDILKRVASEISADNLLLVAGGATFYMLLAMVPFISAVVSIYGLFSDPASLTEHIAAFSTIVPQGMLGIIEDQLVRLTSKDDATLGLTLIVSVGLSLWSANAGMKSIFQSLNVVYDESEKRGFVSLTLTTLVFTIASVATILVLAGTVIVLPVVFSYIPAAESTEWLVQGISFAVMFAIIILGLTLMYRYGPSRSSARWGWLWIGAIVAAVLILVVSLAFTIYVSNFAKFDETYGSLGAIIGFMMWLWLMISVVLVGAELNAEIEHHTIRDTTVGERQPMGQRGAVKADAVPWSSAESARQAGTQRQDTVATQLNERPPAGFAAGAFVGFIVASLFRERR